MAVGEKAAVSSQGTRPLSLPKGGGAVRGIGEKIAAAPVTGTGSMSVPLNLSPGRSGFGPQLALSYDSGSGNGSLGFGWSMSSPAITRLTDRRLPRYEDGLASDVFVLSGSTALHWARELHRAWHPRQARPLALESQSGPSTPPHGESALPCYIYVYARRLIDGLHAA